MMARLARILALGVALWLAAAGLACAGGLDAHSRPPPDERREVLVLMRMPPEHFRPNADYAGGYGEGQDRAARRRIAMRIAQEHGLAMVTDWPLPLVGVDCYVMSVPEDQSPVEVAAMLSHEPAVAWSEPMNVYHGRGEAVAPNDPLYRVQPAANEWRMSDLHQLATGRDVRVAVIDSMIERNHPDLKGQIQLSENFVPERSETPELHGTGVAGVIAAIEGNGQGIAGVAPHARLMALRACWQESTQSVSAPETICDSLSLAKAVHFAVTHDAQVINMSMSGPQDPLLGRLLDVALSRGVTVVGAYDRALPDGGFPASHSGVVAVVDEPMNVRSSGVFAAPGRDVPTTQPGGRWFLVSGSSYAAAHVSGLFALLRERSPRASGASSLVTSRPGVIDACASLLRASGPCNCGCAQARQISAIVRQ